MVALPSGQSLAPIEFLTDAQVVSGVNSGMPRIPDHLLDGIVFLYPTKEDAARNSKFGGTAFLLGRPAPRASKILGHEVYIPFLVSNRHVVWDAGASVPRFNRPDGGGFVIGLDPTNWTVHPDGDDLAAVCVFGLINRVQQKITTAGYELLITEQSAKDAQIGIGDEIFMLGRFINHQGRETIKPAVRFGNISMAPAPIRNPNSQRDQISYAVEMRSRTGFSGAPVIVYRIPGAALAELPKGYEGSWGILGVNWGYILDEDGENTWLNGVVPSWRVIELLNEPTLMAAFEMAEKGAENLVDDSGATPSAAVQELQPPTKDDNPQHAEDFNRLLGAAAKDRKSGAQT